MKITCKVIEDLLPLYHDGICSADSKAIVDGHLQGCEACRNMLNAMDLELEMDEAELSGQIALRKISSTIKKSNSRSVLKGILITLTVFAFLFGILSGVWYFQIGKFYNKVSNILYYSQTGDYSEDYGFYYGLYDTRNVHYTFQLRKPTFLSSNGSLEIYPAESITTFSSDGESETRVFSNGIKQISIKPVWSGGYLIEITFPSDYTQYAQDETLTMALKPTVYVNSELNIINSGQYTASEQTLLADLLERNHDEILYMLMLAEDYFEIDFIETPTF